MGRICIICENYEIAGFIALCRCICGKTIFVCKGCYQQRLNTTEWLHPVKLWEEEYPICHCKDPAKQAGVFNPNEN